MISLQGVSKNYHGVDRVLDQINLEIKRGEFLYVIGGSGAGKSSLLRMLATEESPSSGDLSLFGYSLKSASPFTLKAIRQAMGYVPQGIHLIPDLSVLDNISLSLRLAGRRGTGVGNGKSTASLNGRAKMGELLEKLGLAQKRDVLVRQLSGGEAQRVAVARALVRNPEIIVADEPTGAQDQEFTWMMMDLFVKASQAGTAVVLATHDREIVKRIRKRCAVLRNGKLYLEENGSCFF